ncbi:hypothetical protein ABZT02_17570 [Streptomyces sp. NPDC005402]|uniref:hypothetical protein n=1 Tax=Streptomyces sp. NPDC005402 TaxID=3155338 RepID=UPI00339F5F01
MSEQTPSQAEGEPQETMPDEEQQSGRRDVPRTTPSQAEGDDTEDEDTEQSDERGERDSGWSGP